MDEQLNWNDFHNKVIGNRLYLVHKTTDLVLIKDGKWDGWRERTSLVDGYWMQTIIRAVPKLHINRLRLSERQV